MNNIILFLAVVVIAGVIVYLIDRFVPMDSAFKVVFRVVVILALILWLLSMLLPMGSRLLN